MHIKVLEQDGEMHGLSPLFPYLPTAYIHTDYKGHFDHFAFLMFLLKLKILLFSLRTCICSLVKNVCWSLIQHGAPTYITSRT